MLAFPPRCDFVAYWFSAFFAFGGITTFADYSTRLFVCSELNKERVCWESWTLAAC